MNFILEYAHVCLMYFNESKLLGWLIENLIVLAKFSLLVFAALMGMFIAAVIQRVVAGSHFPFFPT